MERPTRATSVVARIVSRETAALLRASVPARELRDPEGVHQARVALRRLRTDLTQLAGVLDETWRTRTAHELAHFGQILGRRRDLDVVLSLLESVAMREPTLDTTVLEHLDARRDATAPQIRRALGSRRYAHLLRSLVDATLDPPIGTISLSALDALAVRWPSAWDLVGAQMVSADDDATLHALRIATKRARYATEVAEWMGEEVHAIVERAVDAQDSLGAVHDTVVAAAHVEHWYHSPAAARGTDPSDAIESWSRALAGARPHPQAWIEPLNEAILLVEEWRRRPESHRPTVADTQG